MAYGSPQTRGCIKAAAASLYHSHSNSGIWASSMTYTPVHGNTGSLTHWVRPGIKPTTSWILVGFITTEPQWEIWWNENGYSYNDFLPYFHYIYIYIHTHTYIHIYVYMYIYIGGVPLACGTSWVRDRTCNIAATWSTAVITLDP